MIAYEQLTQKGVGVLNEDALITNVEANLFGVVDGVSSLVPYQNANQDTGGYIAANLIKNHFESLTVAGNLFDELSKVNDQLREQMKLAKIDGNKKEELWGAAAAIVRIHDDGVEYIQTGDCMILAVYDHGEVRPLTWRQVSHLEAPALAKWQEGIARGLTSQRELHEVVIDTLRMNRYQSNRDGGYGVLNGEEQATRFFEYGRINRTGLRELILLTDGLFPPAASVPGESSYWSFAAHDILNKGLPLYTQELIELEENDPECINHIRFKKSDDKSAIVIHL